MSSPFGIHLNIPLPIDLRGVAIGNHKFGVSPPAPHPSFQEYYAEESPRFGVVWLKGVSSPFENDAYGGGVQAQLEKLSSQLSTRYGKPQSFDMLHVGSIWDEPRHWVASLYENERSYFHVWKRDSGAQLPEDIETIFLGVLPHNHSDCSLIIEYASTSHKDAERDSDADLADLL